MMFEVQYIDPGRRGIQRTRVRDHATAAKVAVEASRAGCRDALVMRFQDDQGWKIVGAVHVYPQTRLEGRLCVYQDARSDTDKATDEAEAERRAHPQPEAGQRGRLSGLRVFHVRPRRGNLA